MAGLLIFKLSRIDHTRKTWEQNDLPDVVSTTSSIYGWLQRRYSQRAYLTLNSAAQHQSGPKRRPARSLHPDSVSTIGTVITMRLWRPEGLQSLPWPAHGTGSTTLLNISRKYPPVQFYPPRITHGTGKSDVILAWPHMDTFLPRDVRLGGGKASPTYLPQCHEIPLDRLASCIVVTSIRARLMGACGIHWPPPRNEQAGLFE